MSEIPNEIREDKMGGDIDWSDFEGKFFSPELDKEYVLTLVNGRTAINKFDTPVLEFDLTNRDGEAKEQIFQLTSKRAARTIRPIVEKAAGNAFKVKYKKTGEGKKTEHLIEEVL